MLRLVPTQVLAVIAWSIPLLALWGLYATGRETVQRVQALHQIPCANCQFFTNDHRLKCPVHPHRALTEEAVGCQDFQAPKMN